MITSPAFTIVFIALSNSPGMTNYAYFIANPMAVSHRVYVVSPMNIDHRLFDPRVQVIQANTTSPFLTRDNLRPREMVRLIREIHRLRPDIIHFLSPHPWNIPLLAAWGRYAVVHTIHEPIPHAERGYYWPVLLYHRWLVKRFSRVVLVHGEGHLNKAAWLKECKRVVALPLPAMAVNDPQPLPPGRNVLFFGRIVPYKGLGVLLHAVQWLQEQETEVHLTIAGSGDLSPYRDQLATLRHVTIINEHIDEREVNRFFQQARLVVLPYISSSQSGVIPVAYANRRPVIVTQVGALPESVIHRETGWIIEPNRPELLAEAIRHILDRPDVNAAMGENALTYFRRNLDNTVIANRLVHEVYPLTQSNS